MNLKDDYAQGDSHPNEMFSRKVAPLFCRRIIDLIRGDGDTGSVTGESGNPAKGDKPAKPEKQPQADESPQAKPETKDEPRKVPPPEHPANPQKAKPPATKSPPPSDAKDGLKLDQSPDGLELFCQRAPRVGYSSSRPAFQSRKAAQTILFV